MDTPDSPAEGQVIDPPADAPQPATEGGDPQPTESGEIDLSTLPQAVQDHIHELREEAKDRRKEHEPYKNAFSAYNEAEKEYLLNMVTTLAVDQETGAKAMHELSQRMLGIEEAAEELQSDEAVEEAKQQGMSEDDYRNMVRQELEQERMFAQIEAETRAVGFEPGTAEANKLWDLAVALDEDDLSKVAPIARQALGLPEPENAEAQPAPEAEGQVLQAKDVNPEPAPEFPKTAAVAATGADANPAERPTPPKLDSQEMRDRVARRIAQSNQPG